MPGNLCDSGRLRFGALDQFSPQVLIYPSGEAFLPDAPGLVGAFPIFAVRAVTEQLSQVLIFPARRFQIEHEIFHTQPEVIERFLKVGHRLIHSFAPFSRFLGEAPKAVAFRRWEVVNLAQQIGKSSVEILIVHCGFSPQALCL